MAEVIVEVGVIGRGRIKIDNTIIKTNGAMRANNDADRKEIQLVVARLAQGVDRGGRLFSMDELLEACRAVRSFEWRWFEGITARQNRAWFGKLLPQYCGTFTLPDGRRVEFGRHGTDHTRRFTIKVL